MKGSLLIQSGSLKGRKIPLPEAVKGNANFTPALLKKSVFSIIETEVLTGNLKKENLVFLDLFAGSGQMGIEATSRGFSKSILVELDKKRFRGLLDIVTNWNLPIELHHKDGFRMGEKLPLAPETTLIVYIDPPYSFWDESERIKHLSEEWVAKGAKVFIQTPKELSWKDFQSRSIGNNYLLINYL